MAPAAGAKASEASHRGADDTRGRPHYEKLRKDLRQALDKKRELDAHLAHLEHNIAVSEAKYLEETSIIGNIVKGFDNYIKASGSTSTSTGPGTATRRKGGVSEQDKIFSRSSVSWSTHDSPAPLILPSGEIASNAGTPNASHLHSGPSSARDTPGASGTGTTKSNKKKKAPEKDKDDDAEERPSKRQQVSWGRD